MHVEASDATGPRPDPFVGREDEVRTLTRLLRSPAGDGALVVGSPGIGKSRLLRELTSSIPADTVVVWLRFREDSRSPWTTLADCLASIADLPAVREVVTGAPIAPELAQVSPELAEIAGATGDPAVSTLGLNSRHLVTAAAEFFVALSERVPTVVIADDLQWAPYELIEVLERSMQARAATHLLALREPRHHNRPVEELVEWAVGEGVIERVDLVGLEPADVCNYLQHRFERPGEAMAVALELCRQTDGNPFMWREVIEHASSNGDLAHDGTAWNLVDDAAVPTHVHHIVAARLTSIDDDGREVLDLLALAGTPVPLQVLHSAIPRFSPGLAMTEHAGLATVDAATGTVALSHDLIRQHLCERVTPATAGTIHDSLGRAMDRVDPDRWSMEIAHHFLSCGDIDPPRAIDAARRAATSALGELSLSQGAAHLAEARRLLERHGHFSIETTMDLAILEGDLRRRIGDRSHRELLLQAADLAELHGRSEDVARCALSLCRIGRASVAGVLDEEASRLAVRALDLLPDNDSPIRARLLAALSHIHANDPSSSSTSNSARRFYDQAEAMARRVGDPVVLAEVLEFAYWAIDGLFDVPRCRAIAEELLALGAEIGSRTVFEGQRLRFSVGVQSSQPEVARDAQQATLQLAREIGEPLHLGVYEYQSGTLAIIDGDLDELERAATASAEAMQRADLADSRMLSIFGAHMATKAWLTNSMYELTPFVEPMAADLPGLPVWQLVVGLIAAEAGDVQKVQEIYDSVCADDFAAIPDDFVWSVAMCVAAYAVSRVGLSEPSRAVHRRLLPHAGFMSWCGAPTLGPIDQALGETALAFGDNQLAELHFGAALDVSDLWDSPTFRSMARAGMAEALLRSGRSDDAGDLTEAAWDEANRHGIVLVADRAQRLRASIGH